MNCLWNSELSAILYSPAMLQPQTSRSIWHSLLLTENSCFSELESSLSPRLGNKFVQDRTLVQEFYIMCGQVFASLWTSVPWSVNRLDLPDSRQLIASVNNSANYLAKLEDSFIWGKHWKAIHVLGQVFCLFMCLCKCVGGAVVLFLLCFVLDLLHQNLGFRVLIKQTKY